MAWQPAAIYEFAQVTPVTVGNMISTGPQLGQLQDAGFGGPTGGTVAVQFYLPPVGDPHVANDVYIRAADGRWRVSTG